MSIFRNLLSIQNQGRLPSAYQEVEYIQGTGTQYINTGFSPDGNTTVETSIQDVVRSGVLYGAYNSTWTDGYGMYCNAYSDFWYHYYSNVRISVTPPQSFVMEFDKGTTYINGVQRATTSVLSFSVTPQMYIFAGNRAGSTINIASFKLKYAKIYDDGDLVRDFVPCYEKDGGAVGLYDLVTKTFYRNAGNGAFIKGGDV